MLAGDHVLAVNGSAGPLKLELELELGHGLVRCVAREGKAGLSSIQSSLQLGKDVCMHGSGVRCIWKEARVTIRGSS